MDSNGRFYLPVELLSSALSGSIEMQTGSPINMHADLTLPALFIQLLMRPFAPATVCTRQFAPDSLYPIVCTTRALKPLGHWEKIGDSSITAENSAVDEFKSALFL